MAYHLASYHSPTAANGGLHQRLCSHPSDHSSPSASIDHEMLRNLNVKNLIISKLSKALDMAIASLEVQEGSSNYSQIKKLTSLASDDRFEINYVGQNVAATTPSGRVSYSQTPDYRQKIAGVADVLLENQEAQIQQSQSLQNIKDEVSKQMQAIGAESQLPPGWGARCQSD